MMVPRKDGTHMYIAIMYNYSVTYTVPHQSIQLYIHFFP